MSAVLSQREGVFQAVVTVIEGEPDGQVKLSKEEFASVTQIVTEGFTSGSIVLSPEAKAKYTEPKALTKYVKSLINNWLRKDTRLNGGGKYVAKNPGSRAGSGDELLKTLRTMRSTVTDQEGIAQIDIEIEKRQAELNKAKMAEKQISINVDLVPENLRHLLEK